jgi:sulfatase modifying factor 1
MRSAGPCLALLLLACNGDSRSSGPDGSLDRWDARVEAGGRDTRQDAPPDAGRDLLADRTVGCPTGTVPLGSAVCIDRHEAPNVVGASPLVMYNLNEAEAWCGARGKRLCFDDEWTQACATAAGLSYPYGNTHQPGVCNDDKVWRAYDQTKLNGWPVSVCTPAVTSFAALIAAAKAVSATAAAAASHVEWLYQAEPSGSNTGCTNALGAFDLCGNVEEWTRRRDGGRPNFSGNLKGRYWAEARTCQSGVTVHADPFRFYEIGFRCCLDLEPPG